MKQPLCLGIILIFLISGISPLVFGNDVTTTADEPYLSASECAWLDNTDQPLTKTSQPRDSESFSNDRLLAQNQIELYLAQSTGLLVGPMNSAWPMTCNDQHNTGRSPYSTSHITGLEKWRFRCGGSNSGSVIDKEGNIYFADWKEFVISVAPNGTERWRYKMGGSVQASSPALSEDGTLYIGAWDWHIHAFNITTGQQKWERGLGDFIDSSPVLADDGTVYVANLGGVVWALNPNGTTKWVYDTHGSDIWGDIAIADDGTLYVGAHSGYLYAIYPNGTLRWKYKTDDVIRGTPSIGDDGTVYTYSWDDYLYAFYPNNGTVKWRTSFPLGEETNVAIATDGTLYYGGEDLWAFYPNGTLRWVFDPGEHHQIDCSNIAISAEGTLYFGTQVNEVDGGDIVAVNPDGTLKWRKRIADAWVWSSPCIAEDGTVYICSQWD
ncbi:MAG: PQQ-binding-like beta-propeller repeat protein, partial [Candidatus Thermoplasmatota archaeon]|nr:PQQ-binding-like beta-propeller repeat protein [Candidatus Thermoplasmatota archaeon]MBU1941585.1 PQQ-binding-like beta-propeller repeat protein [Candidatus Thermoplasmatota archaeon]